jgi:CDGSH-type Zn-finger protein/truncated hemoglobin YjbI
MSESNSGPLDLLAQALRDAGRDADAQRLGEPFPPASITVASYGPYLVTGTPAIVNWLGEPLDGDPVRALCRCGASQQKPDCDGACVRTGFTAEKSAERVPDHRDTYVGQQVTVFDNRGICQHSGLCTDRLATVFRAGQDPFVAPSGGRMDEIVRSVRDCPSGALSFAIDGSEAREQVDHAGVRAPTVEVTRNGPYRVIGAIPLVAETGLDVPRAEGASAEHYALCRCGHSQNKPFCSGMHWYVDFVDPAPDPESTPTLFEWAGGAPALLRMTRLFYEKYVPNDELLSPIFANMSADHPERVAAWLGEVFGGPKTYSTLHGGYSRMVSEHIGRGLTEEWRARWVQLLTQSAREAGLPNDPEFASAFGSYLEWGSRLAVENSQSHARPPQNMPMPHWDWGTAGSPGSRISALAPRTEPAPLGKPPADGDPVTFAEHIKPLFRESDRRSMAFAFDLWSYDDVAQHAEAVADRLRNGTMPCDGAWPQSQIDLFDRWITNGKAG